MASVFSWVPPVQAAKHRVGGWLSVVAAVFGFEPLAGETLQGEAELVDVAVHRDGLDWCYRGVVSAR